MKKLTAFFILSFLVVSCEEATEWDYKTGQNNQLVVEAIVTNDLRQQEIRLSLSYDVLNDTSQPAINAQVTVNDGLNDFAFSEVVGQSGTYRSDEAFAAQIDQTTHLQ